MPALEEGTLSFTIESRILRELGERLVRQPEVAIIELIKNSYDADATECVVKFDAPRQITVEDNGAGMTLHQFTNGWMRIGTSSKASIGFSEKFSRLITGEKGIGRFAVRFLGRRLKLITIAYDPERGHRTLLEAEFDWLEFDRNEDIGRIRVPYTLSIAEPGLSTGTTLLISDLRPGYTEIDLNLVRTGSIGILTPLRSLFRKMSDNGDIGLADSDGEFLLRVSSGQTDDEGDVAAEILEAFTFRANVVLSGDRLSVSVFKRGNAHPYVEVVDTYPNEIGKLYADIRFFPRRAGSFRGLRVDGRRAQKWITDNHGVAVYDRNFRVHPYGTEGDDWLQLQQDNSRNRRDPRSSLASKHFPMSPEVRAVESQNWMLRLPQSAQLVGLVQVEGRRSEELKGTHEEGLVASADREGFIANNAFLQLCDIVRGAIELIAYADRRLQIEEDEERRNALLASIRGRTQEAITEVRANPAIHARDKERIVAALAETQVLAEKQDEYARDREQQLEVMSLLGVVAGFMTHEFGVAVQELEVTHRDLQKLAEENSKYLSTAESFSLHIDKLREFVKYSSGYIQGAKSKPNKPYPVRPRLLQVKRIFGQYAEERKIEVEITVDEALLAPLVPVSLYNGIALNLYTNALKAVTSKIGGNGKIAFRSWNEGKWHYLEVSDNGVGIPSALHERVFDPLFTTTQSRNDPLGSGMGLGLALVKRGAEAFGGRAEIVPPPPDFATCVRVRFALE